MFAPLRMPAAFGGLAALVAATVTPAPVAAADWQRSYLEPAVRAWMGALTMLAEDGEREETTRDRPGHHHERMHAPGHRHHHPMGPGRPEGPRADALSMLRDISGRLARIERMLAARGPGGPGRGEWGGAPRPELSSAGREMMEARMARMREAREKWDQASPDEREAMKQEWEARMKEGREKRQAAREKWEQASPEEREEMKKQWEARRQEGRQKMERVREEGQARMEAAQPRMEEARRRFQAMEARVKQLEAEVARLKQAAEADD